MEHMVTNCFLPNFPGDHPPQCSLYPQNSSYPTKLSYTTPADEFVSAKTLGIQRSKSVGTQFFTSYPYKIKGTTSGRSLRTHWTVCTQQNFPILPLPIIKYPPKHLIPIILTIGLYPIFHFVPLKNQGDHPGQSLRTPQITWYPSVFDTHHRVRTGICSCTCPPWTPLCHVALCSLK